MGSTNQGLIGQLSVEFLIGEDWSLCALTSFIVGNVAVLELAWHLELALSVFNILICLNS